LFEPKILVEIIGEAGIKSRKKYPIEGDKILIRKGKRGRGNPAYKPSFDKNCILPYTIGWGPFKRHREKLLLIDGANDCVSFNFKNGEASVKKPLWDKETEEDLFKANVIKAAGATVQRVKIPALLYVALFLVVGMQFLTLLVASGRIRLG